MPKDHSAVGVTHTRVYEGEDLETSSTGIRNREKRAADTVVRELKRTKPGAWACIQAREVWSTEEEANMRPGHF
jgi:hypothetical protein